MQDEVVMFIATFVYLHNMTLPDHIVTESHGHMVTWSHGHMVCPGRKRLRGSMDQPFHLSGSHHGSTAAKEQEDEQQKQGDHNRQHHKAHNVCS
jgi:hypothetical protein